MAHDGDKPSLDGLCVKVASRHEKVHREPPPCLGLHLAERGDDAGVGLLAGGVHARTVQRPPKPHHNVVLGHRVAVLVDLRAAKRCFIVVCARKKVIAHARRFHRLNT